jgi:hypothetical protein
MFSPSLAKGIADADNKENSAPFFAPSFPQQQSTTPTPRRVKLRSLPSGKSPSSESQETAFFSPVAARSIDLSDEELDQRGGGVPEHAPSDAQLTPFSGITHSTMRPFDASLAASYRETKITSPRAHMSDSAFTPASADARNLRTGTEPRAMPTAVESTKLPIASTPYKTMPRLDMLSSPYLSSCMDVSTLQRAIRILRSDPNQQFPQLLRVAHSRLEALGVGTGEWAVTDGDPAWAAARGWEPPAFSLPRTPKSEMNINSQLNDSLTLSTDTGEELTSLQLLKQSLEQQPRYNYKRPVHALSDYSPTNRQQAALAQQRMHQTEAKLQHTVREVEELQQLLQTTSLQHDRSTLELQAALETLQYRLDQQRRTNEQSQAQADAYSTRVQALTKQLSDQQRDHATAQSVLQRKQEQLAEFLKSSQRNLDVVTAERSSMLKRMLHAMNPDVPSDDLQVSWYSVGAQR